MIVKLVRKWHLEEQELGYPFLKKCRVLIQNVVKAEEHLEEEQAQDSEEEMSDDETA